MRIDAISAQAHVGAADVKAAQQPGRSQNKVREALGVPLLQANPTAAKGE